MSQAGLATFLLPAAALLLIAMIWWMLKGPPPPAGTHDVDGRRNATLRPLAIVVIGPLCISVLLSLVATATL